MDVRKMRNEKLGARVVAALESRNMEAYYVETKEEAVKKALELIPKGSSINMGGATSVKECGLYDAISNGEYEFYDRDKVKTPDTALVSRRSPCKSEERSVISHAGRS